MLQFNYQDTYSSFRFFVKGGGAKAMIAELRGRGDDKFGISMKQSGNMLLRHPRNLLEIQAFS